MDQDIAIKTDLPTEVSEILKTILTDPPARKDVDPGVVRALHDKGYSYSQIAKALKISKNTVYYHMHGMKGFERELDKHFQNNKEDFLVNTQRRILTSIDDETIKDMGGYQRIISYGILQSKEMELKQSVNPQNQQANVQINIDLRQGIASLSSKIKPISGVQAQVSRDPDVKELGQSLEDEDNGRDIIPNQQALDIIDNNFNE